MTPQRMPSGPKSDISDFGQLKVPSSGGQMTLQGDSGLHEQLNAANCKP
jgi:hypothetical protein